MSVKKSVNRQLLIGFRDFPRKWSPFRKLVFLSLSAVTALLQSNYAAKKPNIVWISTEDMSPWLGAYGDEYAHTPNLDKFAEQSVLYRRAWSNMPICAPARSTLITGCYSTSLGTMNLRSEVPQSKEVKPFPIYLREAGYYCTNNRKTDYNFSAEGIWDDSSKSAHWRNRPDPKQPFFHVVNFGGTHEGYTLSVEDPPTIEAEYRDPARAPIPPYFPDTPGIRKTIAHHYDLISSLDEFFGDVLSDLKADGLLEDTIVFFFSDHGAGLPRYKRWLYDTGLRVPLMVHIPEKFQHLSPREMGTQTTELVGFVDFAPTVLALAGIELPEYLQGSPFLGSDSSNGTKNKFLFGARDRADDVNDLSRCVWDGRFLYIRHFKPHLPYIRPAVIFERKSFFKELRIEMEKPDSPPGLKQKYAAKPFEELYDLDKDPQELTNLANDPAHQKIKAQLSKELDEWVLEIRDSAFLPEGAMMRRAAHDSVYDMVRDPLRYPLDKIYKAAKTASHPQTTLKTFIELSKAPQSGVRYWAASGLLGRPDLWGEATAVIELLVSDSSPTVCITAAELMAAVSPGNSQAVSFLIECVTTYLFNEPTIALQAARSLAELGIIPSEYIPEVQQALSQISGPVWGRYKNYSYPMFIGMALDQVLKNGGVAVHTNN